MKTAAIVALNNRRPFMPASPPASLRSLRASEYYPPLPRTTTPPAAQDPPRASPGAPLFLPPRSRCSGQLLPLLESQIPLLRMPQRPARPSYQAQGPRTPKTPCRKTQEHESVAPLASPISCRRRPSFLHAIAPAQRLAGACCQGQIERGD